MRSSVGYKAGVIGLLLLAGFATQFFRQELLFARAAQGRIVEAETLYLPPVGMLRVLSLGYPTLAADLVHVRAYHYFVKHLFSDRVYRHLDRYVDTIIELDPYINSLYHWAAMAPKMGPEVTPEAVEKGISIAKRGIEYFPNDWQLYSDIGFNYYFELKTGDPEQDERNRELGREFFGTAAAVPGSGLDPSFVTQIYSSNNETELALFHFYNLYLDASEEQRAELLDRIRRLEQSNVVESIARRDAEWKRDFPFVERRFFELLGPIEPVHLPRSFDPAGWLVDDTAAANRAPVATQ